MWATIVDFESYVYPTGSSFIQSLCSHLINSQGGIPITGGAEIRDLYEAHLAITQDVCGQQICLAIPCGRNNWVNIGVNQTPIYLSTACGKKTGFQIVSQVDRCKDIRYYAQSFNPQYLHDLNLLLDVERNSSLARYFVKFHENNPRLEFIWHPHKMPVEPMEID